MHWRSSRTSASPEKKRCASLILFEEDWKIYDSLEYTVEDGVLTSLNPGDVILVGSERGAVLPNGRALSFGTIGTANRAADPYHVLRKVSVGDRVFWHGRFLNEEETEFAGPFRIFLGR
ncbi:MAG: hypothetical protein ACE5GC_03605 [Acidimicrobiia bacterium]